MTNSKQTKRALFSSAVALLLCFTMMLSTTFAWFTDSATSANNVIIAGNLDIDVQYTLDGENWNALDGADNLFEKGLWEPGHTEVVALKIKNAGSLALKYNANMNIVEENIGKTTDGNDIVLSDILTVSTLVQQANDDMGVGDITLSLAFNGENSVGYENKVSFKAGNVLKSNQELFPGDAHYMIVKVDMAETVGNEANHDGTHAPSIDFGINVLATQTPYENDSFGNQYDNDASHQSVIMDIVGLREAAANGGNYILGANLVFDANEPVIPVSSNFVLGLNNFTMDFSACASRPFEMADGSSITVNGTDEVVKVGNYGFINIAANNDADITLNGGSYTASTDNGAFIKPRGTGEINIVLNDVEYKDSSAIGFVFDSSTYTGNELYVAVDGGSFEAQKGFRLENGSTATISNATVSATGNTNQTPAFAIDKTNNVVINKCIINSNHNAIAVSNGATVDVKNCQINVSEDLWAFQVMESGGTINVYDCTYTGKYGSTGKVSDGRIYIDGVLVWEKDNAN